MIQKWTGHGYWFGRTNTGRLVKVLCSNSWLYHLLAMRSWANLLTFLKLNFLSCKMEIILTNAFLNLNNKWDKVGENLIINKVFQKYNNYYLCSTLKKFSRVRKTRHITKYREYWPLSEGVWRSRHIQMPLPKFDSAHSSKGTLVFASCLAFFFVLSPFPLSCLIFMFFLLLLLSCWGSKQTSKSCGLSTQSHFSNLSDHKSFWLWLLKPATKTYCLHLWPEEKVWELHTDRGSWLQISKPVCVYDQLFTPLHFQLY